MPSAAKFSPATTRAMRAHGPAACLRAFSMHHADGEGASTIARTGPATIRTTQQADAAIRAGEELLLADFIVDDGCMVQRDEATGMATRAADEAGLPMTVLRAADTHGWTHVNAIVSRRIGRPGVLMYATILPRNYFS